MATTRKKNFHYLIDGTAHDVTLIEEDGRSRVRIGKREFDIRAVAVSPNCLSLTLDGRTVTVYLAADEKRRYIGVSGRQFVLQKAGRTSADPSSPRAQDSRADASLRSPMPGQVVKILVREGDVVNRDQTVAIVEAMKMENELRASCRARVKKISVRAGGLVDAGEVIVELAPEEQQAAET
jgi:biotin carboxyl carrier protein